MKAEYQKNPKPDKAARIDIVSKVALGEKEVQVGVPRVPCHEGANGLMPTPRSGFRTSGRTTAAARAPLTIHPLRH